MERLEDEAGRGTCARGRRSGGAARGGDLEAAAAWFAAGAGGAGGARRCEQARPRDCVRSRENTRAPQAGGADRPDLICAGCAGGSDLRRPLGKSGLGNEGRERRGRDEEFERERGGRRRI
jgi:hypothetical protein